MDVINRLASFNWVGIISAAVPALSLVVTLTRTPASRRRLNALLDVQERLPDELQDDMTDAVGVHLGYYIAEMEHRAKRKLNKSMVAAEIFVALVGGGAMWLFGWLGSSVHWVFWVVFGVAAVVMFLLLAAGAAQLYADPKKEDAPQGTPTGEVT